MKSLSIGVLLVALGVVQMIWTVDVFMNRSMHMGAPIRLRAEALSVSPGATPALVADARGIAALGRDGFDLLGEALRDLFAGGLLAAGCGGWLIAGWRAEARVAASRIDMVLRLSVQRALLGEIHPPVRQVSAETDERARVVRIRFEYECPPNERLRESGSSAATEVIADFSSDWQLDEQHIVAPGSAPLQPLAHIVYRRAEAIHDAGA